MFWFLNRKTTSTHYSAMAGRKRTAKVTEGDATNPVESSPKKKKTKALDSRFGGMTEEEVMKLLLPDHMQPGLDIIFIGINPGLYSAYLGHHYCNANNHFWPCLYESGLVPRKLTYKEDAEVLRHGMGFTNIVPRTTRGSSDLSRKEMKEWSLVMIERMKELKPLVACFNGKGIYEIFSGKKCDVGLQEEPLPGTETVIYVMPSTSGRAATYPKRADKLKFFLELKQLRDRLRMQRGLPPAQQAYGTGSGGATTTSDVDAGGGADGGSGEKGKGSGSGEKEGTRDSTRSQTQPLT